MTVSVEVEQVVVAVAIDQPLVAFEIENSVECVVTTWPAFERVFVTYMGKPVTFDGKPVYIYRERQD